MSIFTVMRRFSIIMAAIILVADIAIGQEEKSLLVNGGFEGEVAGQVPSWSLCCCGSMGATWWRAMGCPRWPEEKLVLCIQAYGEIPWRNVNNGISD